MLATGFCKGQSNKPLIIGQGLAEMETTSGLEYSEMCQLFLRTSQRLDELHKNSTGKNTNFNYHFCSSTSQWISGRAHNANGGSSHKQPAPKWQHENEPGLALELSDRSQTQRVHMLHLQQAARRDRRRSAVTKGARKG